MNASFLNLLHHLPYEDQLYGWWSLGRVLASGLGAHEKSLLLVLVRLDPRGLGLELSWEQLMEATSLSLSSVRRAANDLRDWGLLGIVARVSEDRQPLPNRFVHALGNVEHPLLKNPSDPFFQRGCLEKFLERRQVFEQTLERLVEQNASAKGPKHKRQGREYSRAPRPWRQSYGMHHPEGQALIKLDIFQYSDLKNNPRENLERLVVMYVRSVAISLGVDSLSSVTPSLIVAWCERTTRSVTRS